MKKKLVCGTLFIGVLCTAIFTACKADVDLGNISPEIKVDMGLALPVGEASATIGDFIGGPEVAKFIHVAEDGVLFYEDTFRVVRNFHAINLAQYISEAEETFPISNHYPVGSSLVGDGSNTQVMEFSVGIKLNGINSDKTYERLDSVWITDAAFTSTFSVQDFNLSYDEIEKLEMILPEENFRSRAGESNIIEIPLSGGFGTPHLIQFQNFSLDLIKDKALAPTRLDHANANVLDSVTVKFRFTTKIKNEKSIPITDNSAFHYDFQIQFLDYEVIWGYFSPSNQVIDADTIIIADEWSAWTSIKKLSLPFARPTIKVNVTTQVGAPLSIMLYSMSTISDDGQIEYATFENSQRYLWSFPDFVNPLSDAFDVVVSNQKTLDNTDSNGRIDKLLAIKPDKFVYSYETRINTAYPNIVQHRLVKNTDLNILATLNLPFVFNKGVEVSYTDTIKDANLSSISLDSIVESVQYIENINTSELAIIIMAENTIPFDVKAQFTFLDKDFNVVDIRAIRNSDDNTFTIAGADDVDREVVISPKKSAFAISLDKENIQKLKSVQHVKYTATLQGNTATVSLLDKTSLKLKVGVSANVDADITLATEKDN